MNLTMNLTMIRHEILPGGMPKGRLVTTTTGLTAMTTDEIAVVVLHDTENEDMTGVILQGGMLAALTWFDAGQVRFGPEEE